MADFADPAWQDSRSDQEIARVVREGRNMMPAFGRELRDDGIDVLVAVVRSLRAAGREPSAPSADSAQVPAPAPAPERRPAAEQDLAD